MNATVSQAGPDEPGNPAGRDLRRELAAAMRACTPAQRIWLRVIPDHHYQHWGAAKALKISSHTVWKWKRDERVKRVLELLDEIAVEDLDISQRRILTEYSNVAFMREKFAYDENGQLLPPQDMPDHAAAAIAERSYDSNGNPKLKFHDKLGALEFLAGFKKMPGTRRLEVTGKDGGELPGATPVIQFVERADDD